MKKYNKVKKQLIDDLEFEGLAGFEEISSYTLLREIKKRGRLTIKKEHSTDRICNKKREKKNKKLNVGSKLKGSISKEKEVSASSDIKGNDASDGFRKISSGSCKIINEEAWRSLFIPDEVIQSLDCMGFKEPTPIQKYTIPAAIRGKKDIIGAAETGSGKTLAFAIPIIDGILKEKRRGEGEMIIYGNCSDRNTIDADDIDSFSESDDDHSSKVSPIKALIITPTRELAVQIKKHIDALLSDIDIKCVSVIGGLALEKQERLLRRNPEIVVGTPGRLWEVFELGNTHLAQLPNIRYLAIDETDRMLEKGHFEELKKLLEIINGSESVKRIRQTFVFSATLTLTHNHQQNRQNIKRKREKVSAEMKIENLIRIVGLRKNPKVVDITRKFGTSESLTETKIFCDKEEKDYYLYYFLKCFPGRTLIFCNSINCVKRLSNLLTLLQCKPQTLHASKIQKQRLSNLEKFNSNSVSVLLATDVAARGIDVPGIDHIVHYEVPKTAETYIHRSGRTARAKMEGLSLLLVNNQELRQYKRLCQTLNRSNDLTSFPIERAVLEKARERVDLACQIEKFDYGIKKKQNNKFWFKKMAEDADIELSDSENDDDELSEESLKNRRTDIEQRNRKRNLENLLTRPMMSSYFSPRYPTSQAISNILASLPVSSSKGALDVIKDSKCNYVKKKVLRK